MRYLYILYQLCIGLPIFLVLTILTALVTTVGCTIGDAHVWGYYPGKWWSKLTCWTFLLPVRVEGREHLDQQTSYVFVANHQGAFDIFLLYGFIHRNFKWMMKKSLRRVPFVGKACESAGHIFVDNSSIYGIRSTIEQGRSVLRDGTSLIVFPEGARTYTGKMRPFKKGAFQLADELQLPIVPLTINGSFTILPRTKKFLHWCPLTLTIHPPIPYAEDADEQARIQYRMEQSFQLIQSRLKY